MARRSLLGVVLAGAGGIFLYLLRGRARERVEVYFADGSLVSMGADSPEGRRLLGLAREILQAAR